MLVGRDGNAGNELPLQEEKGFPIEYWADSGRRKQGLRHKSTDMGGHPKGRKKVPK